MGEISEPLKKLFEEQSRKKKTAQLLVLEYSDGDLIFRCLMCGDEANPIAKPAWHGQHIRTCHPQYVTWARLIPGFDEWTDET